MTARGERFKSVCLGFLRNGRDYIHHAFRQLFGQRFKRTAVLRHASGRHDYGQRSGGSDRNGA